MGLSETIVAAMIGAMATVTTALFQIFSSIKSRNKVDVKPRRGPTMRSIMAVLALMVASAVGGFLYSELLKQRDSEELKALRMEMRELKDLTQAARASVAQPVLVSRAEPTPVVDVQHIDSAAGAQRAESVAYVPACRRASTDGQGGNICSEGDAQRIALCASIPSSARIANIDLFAQPDAVQKPWEEFRALLEQDVGGARFSGKSFEYAQSADLKAVCVNFMHWSSEHSHIARMVVNFGFGEPSPVSAELSVGASPVVISAETQPGVPQQASIVTSVQP